MEAPAGVCFRKSGFGTVSKTRRRPIGAAFGSGSQPRRADSSPCGGSTLVFSLNMVPGGCRPGGCPSGPQLSAGLLSYPGGRRRRARKGGRCTAGPGSRGRGGDAQERGGAEPVMQGWAAVCHGGTHLCPPSPSLSSRALSPPHPPFPLCRCRPRPCPGLPPPSNGVADQETAKCSGAA